MRSVFRIVMEPVPRVAALCVALALTAFAAGANAQQAIPANSTDTGAATLASVTPAAAALPETAADPTIGASSGQVIDTPADSVSISDAALDDQVLARQRGGATGMVMVAATPQLMRGSSVTLWDEIAPPATPSPVPIDASRSAQSNVASFQRR
jgi:hypothetical protein